MASMVAAGLASHDAGSVGVVSGIPVTELVTSGARLWRTPWTPRHQMESAPNWDAVELLERNRWTGCQGAHNSKVVASKSHPRHHRTSSEAPLRRGFAGPGARDG